MNLIHWLARIATAISLAVTGLLSHPTMPQQVPTPVSSSITTVPSSPIPSSVTKAYVLAPATGVSPYSLPNRSNLAASNYVTQDQVSAQLQELANALRTQFAPLASGSGVPYSLFERQTESIYDSIAKSRSIERLSDVALSHVTVAGVTGLTDSDIPDDITASNYLPLVGGTLTGPLLVDDLHATTTSLTINGIVGGLLKTTAGGRVVAATAGVDYQPAGNYSTFAYPFPSNATSTLIAFNGGLTASNATSTSLAVTGTASTSALTVSNSFTFKDVSGFLKATAGAVSTSLINLTSDVTGTLPVASGGTGWSNFASGGILFGNGFGALATSSNFFWDNTNSRLGIGTTTPANTLSIKGTLAVNDASASSVATLGSEIIADGDFATDPTGVWTMGSGWSWDSGTFRASHSAGTGAIAVITIDDGGTGYTAGDTITVSTGSADATYTATVSSGKVTALTQVSAGTGYTSGAGKATTGGTGTGLKVSVQRVADAAVLSESITTVSGQNSLISFTIAGYSGSGSVKVSLGGAVTDDTDNNATSSYYISNGTYTVVLTNGSTITFTPTADFAGAIDNVSAKSITSSSATISINNTDGSTAVEMRAGGGGTNFHNIFIGANAGHSDASALGGGYYNVGTGFDALYSNTSGTYNNAYGNQALFSNTTGVRNIGIGSYSLYSNTTGALNVGIGMQALYSNTTANNNVGIGGFSLLSNTTGGGNAATGYRTLFANTTGFSNTAHGQQSLIANTTGTQNTAVGAFALDSNTTASNNTALGFQAGFNLTTGANNILIGAETTAANANLTTGSNNIGIGFNIQMPSATASNQLNIGNILFGTGLTGAGSTVAGLIGIGTTTPASKLEVYSSNSGTTITTFGDPSISVTNSNSTVNNFSSLAFRSINDTGSEFTGARLSTVFKSKTTGSEAGDLAFLTDNSGSVAERVRITAAGSLGVGSTTPWRTLSVTGTVGFDGLTGTTGAGSLCLSSSKQVVYNSGSDACLSSLRATKHDITPLDVDAIAKILALQAVSFVYNDDASKTTRYGFIAEDAKAVDVHFGTYDSAGNLSGIDDRGLIAVLVEAIQSLAHAVSEFAQQFTSDRVTANHELCVGGTCVTPEQFQAIVEAAGQQSSPTIDSSEHSPTRTGTPAESTHDSAGTSSEQIEQPPEASAIASTTPPAAEPIPARIEDTGATTTAI